MRSASLALLVVVALGAGCSSDPAPPATAEEVVAAWLAALGSDADPGDFVMPDQLPVLASLGRPADAAEIIAKGLSDESARAYWRSLAAGIEETAGVAPSALEIGDVVTFAIEGVDYSFVDVVGGAGITVVAVRDDAEALIDLVATTGPELVRPLATLFERLGPDALEGPAIATSLRAGLSEPGLDLPPQFYGEVQDLIALIDP